MLFPEVQVQLNLVRIMVVIKWLHSCAKVAILQFTAGKTAKKKPGTMDTMPSVVKKSPQIDINYCN